MSIEKEFNDYNKWLRSRSQKPVTMQWFQRYKRGMLKPLPGTKKPAMYAESYRRESPVVPSEGGIAYHPMTKTPQVYTGTFIKGIGTMHKSNSVPVSNQEDAEAIARMRR